MFILLFLLTACDIAGGENTTTNSNQVSAEDILDQLPDAYTVNLKMTTIMDIEDSEETVVSFSTYAITSEGYAMSVGIDGFTSDYIYVAYCGELSCDLYFKNYSVDGNYNLISFWEFQETVAYVSDKNAYYPEDNVFYAFLFIGTLIDESQDHYETTYLDKAMTVYEFSYTEDGTSFDYQVWIEDATNIPWKAILDGTVDGESVQIQYEIISITEGATLPAVE